MFWTVIRWGGSAIIIVLVLAAAFLSSQSPKNPTDVATPVEQGEATPVEIAPADAPPPQNKNFNL